MGNLLFNVRVRYLNWRLHERKCKGCGKPVAGVPKDEYASKALFCSLDCRSDWRETMREW